MENNFIILLVLISLILIVFILQLILSHKNFKTAELNKLELFNKFEKISSDNNLLLTDKITENNKYISDTLIKLAAIIEDVNRNHIEFDKSVVHNLTGLNELLLQIKNAHEASIKDLNSSLYSLLSEFNDRAKKYYEENKNANYDLNKIIQEGIINLNSTLNQLLTSLLSEYNGKIKLFLEESKENNIVLNKTLSNGINSIEKTLRETINVE